MPENVTLTRAKRLANTYSGLVLMGAVGIPIGIIVGVICALFGRVLLAIGGFNGSDPAPTLDEFKAYVAQGPIHYYITSDGMGGTQMGGSNAVSEIATWVAQNYTAQTIGNTTGYDLQE